MTQSHLLRKPTIDDLDALLKHANNPAISLYTSNKFPYPYLKEHALSFIVFANTSATSDIMAIDINGEFVGACGIHFKEDILCKNAELGYWLAEPFWGKGIITQVIKQRVEYAFEHYNLHRIYASVFHPNEGSKKALLKCGFKLEATFKESIYKNNQYYNDCIFSTLNPNVPRET